MMRRLLYPALALLLVPAAARGQSCDVVSSGTTSFVNQGTPQEMVFVTIPVLACPGGRRISADNAYISQASGVVQLMGSVQFQDSARTLRSTNAQYFSRAQRLSASGSVVLVHRTTNSTIRSEQLEYTEATPQRPSHVQAMGGQPVAVFRQAGQPDSTVLRAQQIDIFNDDRLRGTGDARLERDSLVALAMIIEYAQSDGRLDLSGLRTQVNLPRYELIADSTTVTLGDDEQIREVLARHSASLDAEDMDVSAGAIRLFFEDGGVTRMVAMPWTPRPGAVAAGQARVVNEQFNMVADSVDVLAPRQQLQEAVAIGRAHVERATPDSLRPYLPEAADDIMRLIAHDWMEGDTVRAFFTGPVDPVVAAQAAADAAPGDTAAARAAAAAAAVPPGDPSERVLERLYASGGPARAMHKMRPENAAVDAKLSIAYLVGQHVEVTFIDGVVSLVSASEDVRGVYLQPADAARRTDGQPANPRARR
jgi:hypothetical protein